MEADAVVHYSVQKRGNFIFKVKNFIEGAIIGFIVGVGLELFCPQLSGTWTWYAALLLISVVGSILYRMILKFFKKKP